MITIRRSEFKLNEVFLMMKYFLFNKLMFTSFFLAYFTSRLPKLSSSLNENISIGKFLRPTTRICPKRNHFLGEHFCRYAVRLKIFSSADNNEQNDTQLLHTRSMESIKQLDLLNVNHDDCGQIKLPSTGEVLSESINKSLSKWKHNAHHEIRVNIFDLEIFSFKKSTN